jgi:hypothetical protein
MTTGRINQVASSTLRVPKRGAPSRPSIWVTNAQVRLFLHREMPRPALWIAHPEQSCTCQRELNKPASSEFPHERHQSPKISTSPFRMCRGWVVPPTTEAGRRQHILEGASSLGKNATTHAKRLLTRSSHHEFKQSPITVDT